MPQGKSGSIFLSTDRLNLQNGGLIAVFNQGIGDGGKIEIIADEINIQNEGNINASALSGEGGEIFIKSDRNLWTEGGCFLLLVSYR